MKLKQIKQQEQKGFTMIELVIVIAILGILAAFALPRFTNFTQDARTAAANNVIGNYNSAIGIVKAKYIAQGAIGNTVQLNGATINVDSNGDLDLSTSTKCFNNAKLLADSEGGTSVGASFTVDGRCSIAFRYYSPKQTIIRVILTPTQAIYDSTLVI